MAEQNKAPSGKGESSGSATASGNQLNQTGDPGRTPGAAEGDEQTVDEDIRAKESQGKL